MGFIPDPSGLKRAINLALKKNKFMNVNVLIACWSAVWSLTIVALSMLYSVENMSWVYMAFLWNPYRIVSDIEFIILVPIYVFGFWATGCALIVLFHWLFGKFSR